MKKLVAVLLVLTAIMGASMCWLLGNIDVMIKVAITDYGGAMTQAKVGVGAVKIAPADGKGTITNLVIGNPAGFKKDGKKLIVEELTIRDARAQASAAFMNGKTVNVPLPDITLKNLGKAGATVKGLFK